MKNFITFILFVSSIVYGQINSIKYEYQFTLDSLNMDLKIQNMYLLIENNESYFFGENKTLNQKPKLYLKDKNNVTINNPEKIRGQNYILHKNHNKILSYQDYKVKKYKYEEEILFNWKLINEKDFFLGYNVKKAETNFRGRKWIAWYTEEIPISNGPYKFYGLPGLILKIGDTSNTHQFLAVNFNNELVLQDDLKNYEPISKNDFDIFLNKFNTNPDVFFKGDNEIIRSEEQQKLHESRISQRNSKRNNPIELE